VFTRIHIFIIVACMVISHFSKAFSQESSEPAPQSECGLSPKLFVAAKAFINHGGKILILRESDRYSEGTNSGFFDVTGGRIVPGERFDACLMREVREETGLSVTMGNPFFVNEWRPNVRGEPWQIVGVFFECFADSDTVALSEDHDIYKWIDPENFADENLIPNLHLAFEAYVRHRR
jgi:8-oxo-dGTP diphosphatase